MCRYLLICLLSGGIALCGCQRDESIAPDTAEQTGEVGTSHLEETAGRESVEEGTVQVVVRSLSIGDRSVAETRDVRYLPFADTAGEHELVVGMALEAGDLLSSRSGEAVVGLDCGGSTAVLSGEFRVLINGMEGESCVLDLLSGSLDVLADAPTEVNVGGVVLGTEGTAYAVWPTRRDREPRTTVCVYDGNVSVKSAREPPAIDSVGEGVGVVLWAQEAESLPQEEFEEQSVRSARAYAREALARYVLEERDDRMPPARDAYEQLYALYRAVLRDAAAPEPRIDLAKALLRYGEVGKAAYQLRRAGVVDEESLERHRIDPRVLRRGLTDRDRGDSQQPPRGPRDASPR